MRVVEVEVARTHAVRNRVLRPGWDPDAVRYEGDDRDDARHFAVENDAGEVVAVATFLPAGPGEHHLRYMAVDDRVQGNGVGRLLLATATEQLRAAGATRLWCDARDTALGFYERLGWRVTGPGFIHGELHLPHHPMELLLL
jgi:GNAT superfamily N-acetyltransferase